MSLGRSPTRGLPIPEKLGHVSFEQMHIRHYPKVLLCIFSTSPNWIGSWSDLVSDLESQMRKVDPSGPGSGDPNRGEEPYSTPRAYDAKGHQK